MEWRFDAAEPRSIVSMRRQIMAYLARHASPSSDLDAAALVVSELLANVAVHTKGEAWVEIRWPGARPLLRVRDVGPGFAWEPGPAVRGAVGGHGLRIADQLGENLVVERRATGAEVSVVLPVERPDAVSIDPPRRQQRRLPLLSEATPGVGYERDAFLRALVVQLAASAETELGPAVAEQLVAQVGLDVGLQMEAEYRGAMGLDGPLQPHHLAECYVRLKQAIGGGFEVVDVSDEEITLENSACPFGLAVQHSPGLCRMTSSVFGGIAARTTGNEAVVSLEERIAVGDPRCRVVIRLGRAAAADVWGHRYRPPEPRP